MNEISYDFLHIAKISQRKRQSGPTRLDGALRFLTKVKMHCSVFKVGSSNQSSSDEQAWGR